MEDLRIGNVSSEAVEKATGKGWTQWFDFLNKKGAGNVSHKEIVALLAKTIDNTWWCQKISSAYENFKGARVTGQVATGGYQMGMRRTISLSLKEAWKMMTSEEGLAVWLGEFSEMNFKPRGEYLTKSGVRGRINVLEEQSHVRLTWQPKHWKSPSVLQVRVIPKKNHVTISFHHESLPDVADREKMKQHWEKVLDKLETMATE